jgi:hypothetical protein
LSQNVGIYYYVPTFCTIFHAHMQSKIALAYPPNFFGLSLREEILVIVAAMVALIMTVTPVPTLKAVAMAMVVKVTVATVDPAVSALLFKTKG